jgi:hypothetical protein
MTTRRQNLGWSVGEGPPAGFGSQITLGGTGRIVTEFLFGYNGDADVKVDVKFHLNDGCAGHVYLDGPLDRSEERRVRSAGVLSRDRRHEWPTMGLPVLHRPAAGLAEILACVINDGGGWIEVDGHFVKGPPREPVEAMLAALPPQLARRLTPLLQARPLGHHPEAVLRQQLLNAIAQYQAESRG